MEYIYKNRMQRVHLRAQTINIYLDQSLNCLYKKGDLGITDKKHPPVKSAKVYICDREIL